MNIQITNLDINLIEADLQRIFTPYGEIHSVRIDRDQWTNRSRGKAVVDMPVDKEASNAIEQLNGVLVGSKRIAVSGKSSSDDRMAGSLRF